jgi:hypothetical protein
MKAGVGGKNVGGRIKAIQRIENDEVSNIAVLQKVFQVLELEDVPATTVKPPSSGTSPRRRSARMLVSDGMAAVSALMALSVDGWKLVSVHLTNDLGVAEDVDAAMLSIAGIVDAFRKRGFEQRQVVPGINPPRIWFAERYELGRDVRNAAALLAKNGLELWLVDEWVDFEDFDSVLTRAFVVRPRSGA